MSFYDFQNQWLDRLDWGRENTQEVFGKYIFNGLITIEFKRDKKYDIIWRILGTEKVYKLE